MLCFTQEKQTRWKSFNSNSQLLKYRSPLSISLEKHAFLLEVKMNVGIGNWLLLLFIQSFSFSDCKTYFFCCMFNHQMCHQFKVNFRASTCPWTDNSSISNSGQGRASDFAIPRGGIRFNFHASNFNGNMLNKYKTPPTNECKSK